MTGSIVRCKGQLTMVVEVTGEASGMLGMRRGQRQASAATQPEGTATGQGWTQGRAVVGAAVASDLPGCK